VSLRYLYEQYRDQVQFMGIHLREAHPVDGWWLGGGMTAGMLELGGPKAATGIYDPNTMEERREVALQYGIETYVDAMDDAVSGPVMHR
jgi:hypothetical protein